MRKFVYANDALILAYKGGDYHPFACVETVEIEMLTELLESSAPGSGAWEDWVKSGRNSWSARMGGVMVLEDDVDVLWYSWELFLLQVRDQGLNLKIVWKDNEGNEKYATGFVWVPRANVTGTSDDFARWMADFKGSGPLDLNGLLIETITTDVERIDWITTGAEPNKVQSNKLIGLLATDVYEVSLEGDDKYKVITAGAPTDRQVKLDNVGGYLTFLNDFEVGDYVFAIVKKL